MSDEVTAAGTIQMDSFRKSNMFNRITGRGGGSSANVSAKLNFDIPGLKDFKKQLDDINKSLETLNTTFTKLAKGPEAFSKQLEGVVKQMKAIQAAQIQGNRFVTTGTPPQKDPVGQATAAAQSAGGSGGGGEGGGKGGFGAKVGEVVTKGIEAMMKRFDAGMSKAIAGDVYASRMAAYASGDVNTGSDIFRQQGKKGYGFMASDMVQGNRVQYMGTGIGAYMGAGGRAGQRFGAYATSIKQMQEVMPGLDAEQGAQAQTAIANNVQAIKLARVMLGPSVTPNKANGEAKTQTEYFRDVLNALQKLPRPNGQHGAWTRQEIMQMNFPGSRLNAWLSAILPPEVMPMWYEWAINNALSVEKGQGELSNDPKIAKKQLEKAGRGRSLATNAQETTNREAQRDSTFAGEQYGAMNARLDYEKQTLGVLQSIDTATSGIYGLLGRTPSLLQGPTAGILGGLAGGGATLLMGLLGGDPGYANMGDPEGGTSHLTPDLRKRVNSMMKANPNLRISSAYRDNKRQGDLQGKGPFAPSGKSKHGRGQAVDFANEHGWIAKNARKFGLEPATRYGEPWHVQLAGTLNMGDPIDPSTTARSAEQAQRETLTSKAFAVWSAKQQGVTPTGAAEATSPTTGAASSSTPPASGTGGTLNDFFTSVLQNMGAPVTQNNLDKLAAVAKQEGYRKGAFNPFNYVKGPGSDFNKIGVKTYPDMGTGVEWTAKLLSQSNTSNMRDNLLSDGAYADWLGATSNFYHSWGGGTISVSQPNADAYLSTPIGDVGYAGAGSNDGGGTNTVVGGPSFTFHNTFQLSFPNGASRQSIDVATKQIASRLEPQIRRMITRSN